MSTLKQLGYGLALLVALAGFLWIQHLRLEMAEAAQASAESRATQAEQANLDRQHTIDTLTHTLQGERNAQRQLQTIQADLRREIDVRKARLKELEDENHAFKDWAAGQLPSAARRLRQRPALTGSAAYRQWLSGSDPLHPVPDQPHP
jgi:LysB family phage lysis regulatory protein